MTTVLLYTAGVLAMVLGLAISIGLHECGHMVPAKRFGVRVPQFFVGFGKTLWSTTRNGTEYGVKAFPLGGFVKLIGMLPPHEDDQAAPRQPGTFTKLIADARAAEADLLIPGDENRMFYRLPWWKKVIVMSGGPTVNLVIAFFLFGGVFAFHGVLETTTTVGNVAECVIAVPAGQPGRTTCLPSDPVAPSKLAGIKVGDKIVSFAGTPITSYDQLQRLVRASPDETIPITVVRNGTTLHLTARTLINKLPAMDGSNHTVTAGYLGITPTQDYARKGALYTVQQMASYTGQTFKALGHLPAKLWGVGRTVLGLQKRDPNSPMSVVGVSRYAGQVASNKYVSNGDKIAFVVVLLGGVNLFVGMFNFVPLLPLDGGHIAGALYEAVRRRLAKLRGRPDPGHFDVAKLLPVAYVTAGVLLLMTVLLVYADIVKPVA